MGLTDGSNGGLTAADVAAVTGNNNGFGGWGDGSFWIIVLFLFALMGNGWVMDLGMVMEAQCLMLLIMMSKEDLTNLQL